MLGEDPIFGEVQRQSQNQEVSAVSQDVALKYDSQIMELVDKINYAVHTLAKIIKEFRDKRMYLALGYSSFREWYKDKRIPHTTVYRALSASEFIEKYELPEDALTVPQKKMDMLTFLDKKGVINKQNVESWVEKARELTESDFVQEYKTATSGVKQDYPLPPGTYVLVRQGPESPYVDLMKDDVKMIGKYGVYQAGDNFIVRVVE